MQEILLIHHYGGIGGAGVSLLDIVDSLKDNYLVTVVCPKHPSEMIFELKKRNIKIIEINMIGILGFYNGGSHRIISKSGILHFKRIFKSYSEIEYIISQFKGNIVMVNSMTLAWLGKVIKKYNKKAICFHRETFLKYSLGTLLIKNLLAKYFDKIIFISKYDYKQMTLISENRKAVVYDKVKLSNYINSKEVEMNKKQIKILYLGGFSKLKGAHLIVQALGLLSEYPIVLNFVGNISNRPSRYEKRIRSYIEKNSLNINFISVTNEPEKLYENSDIIVFPSTQPHQARPIYEAGLARKPIVISDFRNTEEFIIDNITGFTFKNNDFKDLAIVIMKVIKMEKSKMNRILNKNYVQCVEKHNFSTLQEELFYVLDKS